MCEGNVKRIMYVLIGYIEVCDRIITQYMGVLRKDNESNV